jgi:hypothetical protein
MVSRVTVSRFLGVYLTARSATFMSGETEVMVPLTMVPFLSSTVTVSFWHFIRNLAHVSCGFARCVRVCAPDKLHDGELSCVRNRMRLFCLTSRRDMYAIALRLSCEVGWWGYRSFLPNLTFGRGSWPWRHVTCDDLHLSNHQSSAPHADHKHAVLPKSLSCAQV